MVPRLVVGILIVGAAWTLLLASDELTEGASRPWRVGSLIAVAAVYAGLQWIRDRYFPAKRSGAPEGRPGPLMQKVGKPWLLLAASFVLIAIPLMIVMRSDVALSPFESTRLAFKVAAWGAIVPAIALMIAKFPNDCLAPFFEWWLPSGLLLLLSMVSINLVPGMVLLLLEQADANLPNVATLLIVPSAAFVFRASQFVRKARSGAY